MIFKRKIYQQLLEWKNEGNHNSALLIEGARRVGKSTIVEEFAKNEYSGNYLLVDFRKESDYVKSLFNNIKDINDFFRKFFLSQNQELKKGGLIIFDEVQFCPKARESIKDFIKDGRYDYIETGSLISIKANTKNIMIPSEEKRIDMYPMDFEEFLWAIENNNSFNLFKEIISKQDIIDEKLHKYYLDKFRTYMLIGGMPKVLSTFIETNSYKQANEEKLNILKLYKDDLRKYDDENNTICSIIFDSIPSQLAKENKRFFIAKTTNKKRYSQIEKSLKDLLDFKIIYLISSTSSLEIPLSINIVEDRFKLYFCDTGLLISSLIKMNNESMNKVYESFIKGEYVLNLGSLYESIAVQLLINNNYSLFYHKYSLFDNKERKTKQYEIDLVAERDFKIKIIEIKSSKNYTTSSIDKLNEKYPQLKFNKYVVGIKNIKYEQNKTTLPIYLISLL